MSDELAQEAPPTVCACAVALPPAFTALRLVIFTFSDAAGASLQEGLPPASFPRHSGQSTPVRPSRPAARQPSRRRTERP